MLGKLIIVLELKHLHIQGQKIRSTLPPQRINFCCPDGRNVFLIIVSVLGCPKGIWVNFQFPLRGRNGCFLEWRISSAHSSWYQVSINMHFLNSTISHVFRRSDRHRSSIKWKETLPTRRKLENVLLTEPRTGSKIFYHVRITYLCT
jgi:hypothetical protein